MNRRFRGIHLPGIFLVTAMLLGCGEPSNERRIERLEDDVQDLEERIEELEEQVG